MAEKKVIDLEIKSNLSDIAKWFKNLGTSVKDVNKEVTNLDATFEEVYGDLKPLTARMGEAEDRLYELAKAGKQGSQEYKDLLKSVGEYKRVQQQTDLVVDAAAQTMGSKLTGSLNAAAGGFSLAQGSMALFGAESSSVEEAMLKVQAAMAISQGVETITQSGKSVRVLGTALQATTIFQKISAAAQYVWNVAMAANPIGALVVAVSALLIGGYKLIKFFKDSSDANEKAASSTIRNANALKEQSISATQSTNKLKTYNDQQYALAQAAGMSSEGLRKLALKHKEEEIALNKKNAVLAQSTFLRERDTLASLKNSNASDEVIANQEKLTQETYKNFTKQNEILDKSYKERAALRNANAVGEVSNAKANADKVTAANKEANDKRLTQEKADAATLKTHKDDILKNQQKMNLDKIDQEIQEGVDEKERKRKSLEDISLMVDMIDAEDIRKAKVTSDEKIAIAQAESQQKKDIQNAQFALADGAVNFLKQISGKNKAIQKASIIAENAIGIGKMIIANNAANIGALATPQAILTSGASAIPVIAMNNITTALGVATTIASTAKALAAVGGGSGGSSPSVGGGNASAPAAPSFNVVGASSTNQLAQTIGNKQNEPIQAYVVSNHVTTQQGYDRNILKSATIG